MEYNFSGGFDIKASYSIRKDCDEVEYDCGCKEKEEIIVKASQKDAFTVNYDYDRLTNKPSINGVELVGDKTGEDLHLGDAAFPDGGKDGDLLVRVGTDGVGWATPANHAEQDNTRPITSAAVYLEIGNINALLAII